MPEAKTSTAPKAGVRPLTVDGEVAKRTRELKYIEDGLAEVMRRYGVVASQTLLFDLMMPLLSAYQGRTVRHVIDGDGIWLDDGFSRVGARARRADDWVFITAQHVMRGKVLEEEAATVRASSVKDGAVDLERSRKRLTDSLFRWADTAYGAPQAGKAAGK